MYTLGMYKGLDDLRQQSAILRWLLVTVQQYHEPGDAPTAVVRHIELVVARAVT